MPTTLTPELVLPPYLHSQNTEGIMVYYCPDGRLYDLIRQELGDTYHHQILPDRQSLAVEHQRVEQFLGEQMNPDTWGDWFDFRRNGAIFHLHLSWHWGNTSLHADCECYISGPQDHLVMKRLPQFLRQRDIPCIPYIFKSQPFIEDIIA